jgi:hypothetical protein
MTLQNMLVYSTDWYGRRTFRMLPVTEECPFNEVIFDPSTKVLAVISKEFKEKPHMFPKLNVTGKPLYSTDPNNAYVEERIVMDTYYEYYLDDMQDIRAFVNRFAINSNHSAINILDEVLIEE